MGTLYDSPVWDTGKGKSKSSIRKVTFGFHLVEGKQGHTMEDYHVAEFKQVDGYEVGLFAIFDGHSDEDVASYLRNHLFNNILHKVYLVSSFSLSCSQSLLNYSKEIKRYNGILHSLQEIYVVDLL